MLSQRLYTIGGASVLQTIDIATLEVNDLVTVSPLMSDIAFHPDGNLYGVSEHTIYRIDTTDGSTQALKILPSSMGWLLGMTIDHNGQFWLSSLGSGTDLLLTYDASSDLAQNLGSLGFWHWDLEFFNGKLYAAGGTDDISEGLLIEVNPAVASESKNLMDYEAQAYAIAAFNDHCGSSTLVAPTIGELRILDPYTGTYELIAINDPLYSGSSGSTTRTSYLGSKPGLIIESVDLGDTPCSFEGSTTAVINVGTGRPGLQFSIDGVNYQDSPAFEGLLTGIYQFYVRDSAGCEAISEPVEIINSEARYIYSTAPAYCDEDNGVLTASPQDSTDALLFSLDGIEYLDLPTFNGLAPGKYWLRVKNSVGCVDSVRITIQEIPMLTQSVEATAEHCSQEDGSIEVSAEGGQAPYSYAIVGSPPQSSPLFSGLHAATYGIRTVDNMGCMIDDQATVDSHAAPEITSVVTTTAHCNQNDGTISIETWSSTGTVQVSLNGGAFTGEHYFESLPAGVYDISIVDEYGCAASTSITIETEDGPVIEEVLTTDATCARDNGKIKVLASSQISSLQYSLNGGAFKTASVFRDLAADTYTLAVKDSFGCTSFTSAAVEAIEVTIIDRLKTVDATCLESNGTIQVKTQGSIPAEFSLDGVNFSSDPKFRQLAEGMYLLYLEDRNGCRDSLEAFIDQLGTISIIGTAATDASCKDNDGSIEITSDKTGPEIEFWVTGTQAQASSIIDQLPSGHYEAFARDENGCVDSARLSIAMVEPFTLLGVSTLDASCGEANGSILLETSKEVAVEVNGLSVSSSDYIPGLSAGAYRLTLTDENHCRLETVATVKGVDCNIYIPNAFSPNGDGANDVLAPVFEPTVYELESFVIVDRWGNQVFDCNGQCEWDGSYKGERLNPGVFAYQAHFSDVDGNHIRLAGDVSLLR